MPATIDWWRWRGGRAARTQPGLKNIFHVPIRPQWHGFLHIAWPCYRHVVAFAPALSQCHVALHGLAHRHVTAALLIAGAARENLRRASAREIIAAHLTQLQT